MIGKCVVVLAVIAQINGYVCNTNGAAAVVASGYESAAQVGATRNIVAKGKYPVALSNNGPALDMRVPVTTSQVSAPLQEKPTIRLAANIPAPRTVAHACTCYKTIMRPRVHQQVITVPSVQRYIETSHTPVVENIHYEAVPVNCADTVGAGLALGAGVASLVPGSLPIVSSVPVASTSPVCASTGVLY